jgi:hypothetical protein
MTIRVRQPQGCLPLRRVDQQKFLKQDLRSGIHFRFPERGKFGLSDVVWSECRKLDRNTSIRNVTTVQCQLTDWGNKSEHLV